MAETTKLKDIFRQHIKECANTGNLIILPPELSTEDCALIMAEEASRFIDQQQDIKAIILLEERKRLKI